MCNLKEPNPLCYSINKLTQGKKIVPKNFETWYFLNHEPTDQLQIVKDRTKVLMKFYFLSFIQM